LIGYLAFPASCHFVYGVFVVDGGKFIAKKHNMKKQQKVRRPHLPSSLVLYGTAGDKAFATSQLFP
jgi:hypothetical protein